MAPRSAGCCVGGRRCGRDAGPDALPRLVARTVRSTHPARPDRQAAARSRRRTILRCRPHPGDHPLVVSGMDASPSRAFPAVESVQCPRRPLAFNWQSATFSLPALVGYLVPLRLDFTVQVLLPFVIAGTGMYVLGRVMRLGVLGAAMAATVFELCGTFQAVLGWPVAAVMSWAGWLFACAILVLRGGHRRRSVVLFAVVFAARSTPESPTPLSFSLSPSSSSSLSCWDCGSDGSEFFERPARAGCGLRRRGRTGARRSSCLPCRPAHLGLHPGIGRHGLSGLPDRAPHLPDVRWIVPVASPHFSNHGPAMCRRPATSG